MKYGFGVDLGGTTVKIAYFDDTGKMLEKWEIPTDRTDNGKNILPDIAASVKDYIARCYVNPADIVGIGIGVPGAVMPDGTVNKCINLGWGVFNIEKELSELTGYPVKSGNDATVAAMGEYWKGGGQGCDNMVFATLGTGVGGGIVVGGKVIHGTHGAGGELGHLVLNRNETEVCGCGKRGCVEQYCSATGIVRLAKKHLAAVNTPSSLRDLENLTCKDVFDAGAAGDAVALEILEQVYSYLGEFLANLCCVLDPEVVVLGGGVSKAGKPLIDGVRKYYQKLVFHAAKDTRIELASLCNDAGAYGAFKLVLDTFS